MESSAWYYNSSSMKKRKKRKEKKSSFHYECQLHQPKSNFSRKKNKRLVNRKIN